MVAPYSDRSSSVVSPSIGVGSTTATISDTIPLMEARHLLSSLHSPLFIIIAADILIQPIVKDKAAMVKKRSKIS